MSQLSKQQVFVILLVLLIFYTLLGVIIAITLTPVSDFNNLLRIVVIFLLLTLVAYLILRTIFRLMQVDIPDSVRAFSSALPDRAVVLNAEGVYVEIINETYDTGLHSPSDVVGKKVSELYPNDFSAFVMETINSVLTSNQPRIISYSHPNLKDELVHYEGRIIPYKDHKTGDILVIWSSRDVSGRIEAEQMRLDLAVERNKVQFLRDFVNNMTHDFKTPLAVINTNVHIARKTKDSLARNDRLNGIQDQVKKITQMVDDMLESARLEGDNNFVLEATNLRKTLSKTVKTLTTKAEKKQISLQLDMTSAPSPTMINAVPRDLSRALMNLVDNAIKYTDKGGAVDVYLMVDNQQVKLVIKDTGIGIASTEIEHIFDRFHRTDEARFFASGTGLGLSIVKLILDRHDGSIDVISEKDKGSTFTITLPLLNAISEHNTLS